MMLLSLSTDLTPPQVQLSSVPPGVTNETEWTLRFSCVNEHSCTYMCSVHEQDDTAHYVSCSGIFPARNLQTGNTYEFAVIATDAVGNVGGPYIYQWKVGEFHNILQKYLNWGYNPK